MNSVLTNNIASSNLSAVSNADDALDMQQALQFVVNDKIRNSILVRIENTKSLGQKLLDINSMLNRLRETNPGNYQSITLQKFQAAKANESDLINLLQSDGPKLGNSLVNSQSFITELNNYNLNIQTSIRYPVLTTTFDKDGVVMSTVFSFMNQSERNLLNSLNNSTNGTTQPIFIKVSEGENPITTQYESFDSFANLIPALADINSSIATLNNQRGTLQSQYSKELAVLSASAKKIQDQLLNFQIFSKEDESKIRKLLEERKNDLLNIFNDFELSKNNKNTVFDTTNNSKTFGATDKQKNNASESIDNLTQPLFLNAKNSEASLDMSLNKKFNNADISQLDNYQHSTQTKSLPTLSDNKILSNPQNLQVSVDESDVNVPDIKATIKSQNDGVNDPELQSYKK